MFEFTATFRNAQGTISAIENDLKVKHGAGAESLSGSETSPNKDSEPGPPLAKRVKQPQPLEMGEKHSSNTEVQYYYISYQKFKLNVPEYHSFYKEYKSVIVVVVNRN